MDYPQAQARFNREFEKLASLYEPGSSAIVAGFIAAELVICDGFVENFYNQVDHNSDPWAPRKDNLPHPLLIKTGRMFAAATNPQSPEHYSDIENGLTLVSGIGEAVFYAGFHHYGTYKMPARRVIYATESTINRALEAFADAAEKEIFG